MRATRHSAQYMDADPEDGAGDDFVLDAEDGEYGTVLDDLETLQDFRGIDLD